MFCGNTMLIVDLNVTHWLVGAGDILCGYDISHLSAFPSEEEFLIWPGTQFNHVKYEYDSRRKRHIIYLRASNYNDYKS